MRALRLFTLSAGKAKGRQLDAEKPFSPEGVRHRQTPRLAARPRVELFRVCFAVCGSRAVSATRRLTFVSDSRCQTHVENDTTAWTRGLPNFNGVRFCFRRSTSLETYPMPVRTTSNNAGSNRSELAGLPATRRGVRSLFRPGQQVKRSTPASHAPT